MLKLVTALSAALIIGWALVGSAATASAGYRKAGCCGPLPPSYTYNTKKVHKNITRHHDVWRTRYVKRVHTRLVGVVHPVHERVTQYLPAQTYTTHSTVYLRPECGCSYGGY